MTTQEDWKALAQHILKLVAEDDQRAFQQWMLDRHQSKYVHVAEALMTMLEEFRMYQGLELDGGL